MTQNSQTLQKHDEETKPVWADSWCITRWQKPNDEIIIWKKLTLEESLLNLQTLGDFILDKKLWVKMYLEMLGELETKLNTKLSNNIDYKEKKDSLKNSTDKNSQNSTSSIKIKNLQKILKSLNSQNEQNWQEMLADNLGKLENQQKTENNLKTSLEENIESEIAKSEKSTNESANLLSKLHESVLLEFWKTENLEFWAIICGQFWEREIKNYLTQNNKKVGDYLWPLRVCLSGQKQSPSPFEILACLDYLEAQKRIKICSN